MSKHIFVYDESGNNFAGTDLNIRPPTGLLIILKSDFMVKGSYIPQVDHTIAAPLEFMNAGAALAWYKNILGAEEQIRFQRPDKKVIYAEMSIGDSMFYLDKVDTPVNGTPGRLHVFVEDVDKILKKALRHGATLVKPAQDQLYGERCGWMDDPFGYKWVLATRRKFIERRRNVA